MTEENKGWLQSKLDRMDAWSAKMDAKNAADSAKREEEKTQRQEAAAQRRDGRAVKREERALQRDEQARLIQEKYGNLVKSAEFGMKTIEIYDRGYVRIGMLLTAGSTYEKLKSIKFTHHTRDQSPGGRAVANALTLGLNSFTSPEDQKLSLTIVTDKKVHTLSDPAGSGGDLKRGLALEAAGQAVVDASKSEAGQPRPVGAGEAAQPDVLDQIKKLADLHAAGILTDDEFAAKKADLLNRM